ncbi:hypothetical protein [Nocardioides donggukensis]|uniref:Uncharacterized protein n=1 Tax=Nocardioides donggukensis TaxID=2774019 RepID=A0A927K4Y2_9ACTN|nr:hypothetical protein [Nocardioides donggukensis]MBD8870307.1 hypothetical protein [Nocardioides donggukensis]
MDPGPDSEQDGSAESYNPWSVVNLVFTHLADQGLHPTLGETGDPGPPARDLLIALGIEPAPEGNREVMRDVRANLAEIRAVVFGEE